MKKEHSSTALEALEARVAFLARCAWQGQSTGPFSVARRVTFCDELDYEAAPLAAKRLSEMGWTIVWSDRWMLCYTPEA